MTDEIRQPLDDQIMKALAIAHISMLTQAARGDFRMQADDAESRQAWLLAFVRTGAGIASEENRQLAQQANELLGTQFGMLSTQPEQERRTA